MGNAGSQDENCFAHFRSAPMYSFVVVCMKKTIVNTSKYMLQKASRTLREAARCAMLTGSQRVPRGRPAATGKDCCFGAATQRHAVSFSNHWANWRHLQRYFSISDAQFKVMDRGAALGSSTFVLIRNF